MLRRLLLSGGGVVKQSITAEAAIGQKTGGCGGPHLIKKPCPLWGLRAFAYYSSTSPPQPPSTTPQYFHANEEEEEECSSNAAKKEEEKKKDPITLGEAKKLMRLVNIEALKTKLGMEGKEVIGYSELLDACKSTGMARSHDESVAFARVLDEAGVVLLFRDKVYLHPQKVVDLIRRAIPLALVPEDDPTRDELKMLQEKKEEIDLQAHKQVRRILWSGLAFGVFQVGLFFRLTFWEFSWDVMEPIAFFTTSAGIVIGYAYFMFTSRDPTYQDLLKRLFLSRQRKLFQKHNFDVNKFKELQTKCNNPGCHASITIRNRMGMDLELEDALHRD